MPLTAIDRLKKEPSNPETKDGFMVEGEVYHVPPFNRKPILDFTCVPGKGSATIFSFLFWLAKWRFKVFQAYSDLEVSPLHAQYYQISIQQKQQLESQIKSGLASITSSMSDFELLFHDLRKYKEHVELFEKMEQGKEEKNQSKVTEAEQSLKAIFIDEVDVHTGEGIALKLIAPRWPTIISDFMQLKDEDRDPKKIAVRYNISEAEGVVLSTKNKLFFEWKKIFRQTVYDRFNRIFSLAKARKKSIQEYKDMLKPYIARYKSIAEMGASEEGRQYLLASSWTRPNAQSVAVDRSVIWAMKAFHPPDFYRAGAEAMSGDEIDVRRMPFPPEFREQVVKNYDALKDADFGKVKISPNGIEPLDKYVIKYVPYIEEKYKIKVTPVVLLEARKKFFEMCGEMGWIDPYFCVLDMTITRNVIKLPDGSELEDITIDPFLPFLDTQNIVLLRMLELKAQEIALENYIKEMIGEMPDGAKVQDVLKEYDDLFEYKFEAPEKKEKKKAMDFAKESDFGLKFFRRGPYEPHFEDRVNGAYFREMNDLAISPAIDFWKGAFDVPGFRRPGFVT